MVAKVRQDENGHLYVQVWVNGKTEERRCRLERRHIDPYGRPAQHGRASAYAPVPELKDGEMLHETIGGDLHIHVERHNVTNNRRS